MPRSDHAALTARSIEWLSEVGPNGWQPFHALGTDRTHPNDAGAAVMATFVRELRGCGHRELQAYLR